MTDLATRPPELTPPGESPGVPDMPGGLSPESEPDQPVAAPATGVPAIGQTPNYVIDSFDTPIEPEVRAETSEGFAQDAKEVAAGFENKEAERAELQRRMRYLDEVLSAGKLHARRIVESPEASGLSPELHDELKSIAQDGRSGKIGRPNVDAAGRPSMPR